MVLLFIIEGLQLPMSGALDVFDKIPGKPLMFNEVMNILRDIVTSINSIIRRESTRNSQKMAEKEQESNMRGGRVHRINLEDKVHTELKKSLEKKIHRVVQYLLYFRNTDGSFGEPMAKQSIR